MTVTILRGDCRHLLKTLPDELVHCCVCSPPYWGLRDYGHGEQIGLEPTPEAYVSTMVEVFREVRRVMRKDGTLWLNLGDSYAGSGKYSPDAPSNLNGSKQSTNMASAGLRMPLNGLKSKDLVGIPWRVAFALQADGWYLRQDIIWAKPNPMPESVTDRCTKAHEYIFLLSKSSRYFYDAEAIAEQSSSSGYELVELKSNAPGWSGNPNVTSEKGHALPGAWQTGKRNKRSVWTVATQPFSEAHFATFPPALIEPCVMAGCPKGCTVLDPFGGAGTTGMVADRLGRDAILIELKPEYADMAEQRLCGDAGMFAEVTNGLEQQLSTAPPQLEMALPQGTDRTITRPTV